MSRYAPLPFLGLPRLALAPLLGELLRSVLLSSIFLVPAAAGLATSIDLQRWGGALISGIILVWVLRSLLADIQDGLGIRLVPRFHPPLSRSPGTWFTGRELLRSLPGLAQSDVDLTGLSIATPQWVDPAAGRLVLQQLSAEPGSRLQQDLVLLDAALALAAAEGARFHMVVVFGSGMNGMLWQKLTEQGY